MTSEEYLSGAPIIGLSENIDDFNVSNTETLLEQEIADYNSDQENLFVLYGEMITISRKAQFVLDLDQAEQNDIISKISEFERNLLLARICMVISFNYITLASDQQAVQLPKRLVN